ncbi:MAG TPA: nitroreductase family protein [Desulfobaccales bacterium]
MELSAAVKTRKSIRAFKTDAVPKEVITQILETARWSPSWGNTQPWELVVVQGDKVRQLTGEMVTAFQERMAANPDVAMPGTFPDVYKERYMACAAGLFGSMGVARDDKASRMAHMVKMTGGFGAPVIIYVIFNVDLTEPYSMFDLGAITHGICLAAHDLGLGICIEAQLALYPDIVRRHLGLGTSHKIVVGLALGYPDLAHPANAFRTEREPLEKFVQWIK